MVHDKDFETMLYENIFQRQESNLINSASLAPGNAKLDRYLVSSQSSRSSPAVSLRHGVSPAWMLSKSRDLAGHVGSINSRPRPLTPAGQKYVPITSKDPDRFGWVPSSLYEGKNELRKTKRRRKNCEIIKDKLCPEPSCDKAYATLGALNTHIRLKHEHLEPVEARGRSNEKDSKSSKLDSAKPKIRSLSSMGRRNTVSHVGLAETLEKGPLSQSALNLESSLSRRYSFSPSDMDIRLSRKLTYDLSTTPSFSDLKLLESPASLVDTSSSLAFGLDPKLATYRSDTEEFLQLSPADNFLQADLDIFDDINGQVAPAENTSPSAPLPERNSLNDVFSTSILDCLDSFENEGEGQKSSKLRTSTSYNVPILDKCSPSVENDVILEADDSLDKILLAFDLKS